jgi:hypothetical protein
MTISCTYNLLYKNEVMGNRQQEKLKKKINEGGRYRIEENWTGYIKLDGKNCK